MSRPLVLAALFLCSLAVPSAGAQESTAESAQSAPANLAYVEGGVDLVHEGVIERADPPMMLVEGDILRTRSGRAEIVFADGSLFHLDFDAEIEILGPERVRLLRGRTLIRVSSAANRPYVIDTPAATVRLDSSGEYGIAASLRGDDVEVTVARGHAEIDDGSTRATIRSGEMVSLAASGARPLFQPFNSARLDAFAQWANDRTRGFASAQSAAQLPYELRPYGPVLDHYGRWDYMAPYGYVWYPSVGVAWRPYYDGWWSHTRYGWTWYGRDRWAWPTHHYGRWGYSGSFWFWIPSKIWGPAWVSWGRAPGFVSWCPLGWDNRPVFGYAGYYGGYPYDPWRSWTVLPRNVFGHRRSVRLHAVDGGRLDADTRSALLTQSTPLRGPGSTAVPRGSTLVPGGNGDSRRADDNFPRRGDVRRPQAPAPSGDPAPEQPTVIDRSSRDGGAPRRSVPERYPAPDPRGRDDNSGAIRRGSREAPPATADDGRRGDSDRGERPGGVREARPRSQEPRGPAGGERPADNGGARRGYDAPRQGDNDGARQGGARERGGTRAPATASPPGAGGGAVRRRP